MAHPPAKLCYIRRAWHALLHCTYLTNSQASFLIRMGEILSQPPRSRGYSISSRLHFPGAFFSYAFSSWDSAAFSGCAASGKNPFPLAKNLCAGGHYTSVADRKGTFSWGYRVCGDSVFSVRKFRFLYSYDVCVLCGFVEKDF